MATAPRLTVPSLQSVAAMVPSYTVPMVGEILRLFDARPARRYIPTPAYRAAADALARIAVLQLMPSGEYVLTDSARAEFPGGAL